MFRLINQIIAYLNNSTYIEKVQESGIYLFLVPTQSLRRACLSGRQGLYRDQNEILFQIFIYYCLGYF